MVAETEPFGSNKNGEKEEKWVVEICVPDRGSTHNRKGEVDVEGKDAAGLCVGPVTGDREGVEGECVVLVNGEGGKLPWEGEATWFLLLVEAAWFLLLVVA